MTLVRTPARLAAVLLALFTIVGACSSGSDEATATSDTDSAAAADDDASSEDATSESDTSSDQASSDGGDSGDYALTCDEATELITVVRGSNGWLTATAAGNGGDLDPDFDATIDAVQGLRAIQDVEGLFGTMRAGLDNVEADAIAASEGRNADMVGDYDFIAMNAVIGEEICG